MFTINKLECGAHRVVHYFGGYSPVCVDTREDALSLCRIRLNKCREHEFDKEPLTIIKVPFINFWIVW